MTDPRLDDRLLAAIRRLPGGSGVVFRHRQMGEPERRRLFARVRRLCRRRGHVLLLAGSAAQARAWGADGVHGRVAATGKLRHSAPVHDPREIALAKRLGAELLFVSPVRKTASHPGSRSLGAVRFNQLARLCAPAKVVALGGMNRAHAAKWRSGLIYGWAAIDAFGK